MLSRFAPPTYALTESRNLLIHSISGIMPDSGPICSDQHNAHGLSIKLENRFDSLAFEISAPIIFKSKTTNDESCFKNL